MGEPRRADGKQWLTPSYCRGWRWNWLGMWGGTRPIIAPSVQSKAGDRYDALVAAAVLRATTSRCDRPCTPLREEQLKKGSQNRKPAAQPADFGFPDRMGFRIVGFAFAINHNEGLGWMALSCSSFSSVECLADDRVCGQDRAGRGLACSESRRELRHRRRKARRSVPVGGRSKSLGYATGRRGSGTLTPQQS